MKKRWWFYGLVTLQLLFLLLMSASYYAMDLWGQTITLKTAPVDPRDPFYGDYVTLDYTIEQIPEEKWLVEETLNRGEKIFLLLEENEDEIYELVEASTLWPETESNQVVLSSKYQWSDPSLQQYQVDIGLGRYYIEENTGTFWEQREEREVEIVLAPWKQKKIASLK
ncbi:GDYXXLXY domain-containing protein [Halobacillus faecis]